MRSVLATHWYRAAPPPSLEQLRLKQGQEEDEAAALVVSVHVASVSGSSEGAQQQGRA